MATEKQIAANKRNASRSTGPKSIEGKAKAARNALKHGLAGHGVVFPEEMADQIHDRMNFLRKAYRPDGPAQEWLFVRICTETVRADHGLHRVIALRDEAATQAGESWDDDRALEAEELGAAIGRKPELVQPSLIRSKHGALWLVAQWEELERQFDLRGEWPESASSRALDLLGVPIDARLGVWDSLAGIDPRALVREQVDALQRRLDGYLEARDDRARSDALAGLSADGPDVRRALRYEGAALRRLQALTRDLRRLQNPSERRPRIPVDIEGTPSPDQRDPDLDTPGRASEPTGDAPRAVAVAPAPPSNVGSKSGAARGAFAPSDPSVPQNRHARRAHAALRRRSPRS